MRKGTRRMRGCLPRNIAFKASRGSEGIERRLVRTSFPQPKLAPREPTRTWHRAGIILGPMAFKKDELVHFKKVPSRLYGKVVNVIDEGPDNDQSVVVQPEKVRCQASDLESAELPETPMDKTQRILNGPGGEILEQWAASPSSPELQSKLHDLMRELGWIKSKK
jgi:hypothetical protein